MPSFEWNKIIASILTALIVAMVSGILAEELYRTKKPATPVFLVAGPQKAAPKGAPPSGPKRIAPFLAKADAKRGKSLITVCSVCHTFNKGGPNKIGPNLYAIPGSKIAEDRNGFEFSAALQKHKGVWTADRLNRWLLDPQKFAAGTKMTFSGIKNEQKRADIIAYLQSLGGKLTATPAAKAPAAPPAKSATSAKGAKGAEAAGAGFAALLKKADAKKGQTLSVVCAICHSFNKGEANKIGPNLFAIVGAKIAEDRSGFGFSPALKKVKGSWTPQLLNKWLEDPAKFAPGTMMSFAGIKNAQERADVIAYLESLK